MERKDLAFRISNVGLGQKESLFKSVNIKLNEAQ